MQVDVLRKTEKPERLVCQAARGDYFEGYVGDTDYWKLMSGVDYSDNDMERAKEMKSADATPDGGSFWETEAATLSFIEKQLSRGHYGPWEHPQITLTVKGVSRVTMAQITRHRLMSFDIQSMRYADFSNQEIVTPRSLREETLNRETGVSDVDNREGHERAYGRHIQEAVTRYEQMVADGVPKEDARFILPLGTTVNMTFSGNARTFMHLLDMRKKANAQWEIRELSEKIIEELKEWMLYSYSYYEESGPHKLAP